MVARIEGHCEREGFGFRAAEVPGIAPLIGPSRPMSEAPFTAHVEIGWRLVRAHRGKDYAAETALASLRYGFEKPRRLEMVAFTVPGDARSRAVMERIGITRSASDDFDHPALPVGCRLRRHMLQRIRREAAK